jgi:hypothetical protein
MEQGVQVVVTDVMHVGKDAADTVRTGRDGSNVRCEARFELTTIYGARMRIVFDATDVNAAARRAGSRGSAGQKF